MWNRIKTLSVMCLLFLLPGFAYCADVSSTTLTTPQSQTVKMSKEQYMSLKRTVAQLEVNLETLSANSASDKKEIEKLQQQLEDCKTAMNKAQESSKTADSSLAQLETHLETLTAQTKALQNKLAIKNRQNKTAWVIAGVAIIAAVSK